MEIGIRKCRMTGISGFFRGKDEVSSLGCADQSGENQSIPNRVYCQASSRSLAENGDMELPQTSTAHPLPSTG